MAEDPSRTPMFVQAIEERIAKHPGEVSVFTLILIGVILSSYDLSFSVASKSIQSFGIRLITRNKKIYCLTKNRSPVSSATIYLL
jgi:hypothetical protein